MHNDEHALVHVFGPAKRLEPLQGLAEAGLHHFLSVQTLARKTGENKKTKMLKLLWCFLFALLLCAGSAAEGLDHGEHVIALDSEKYEALEGTDGWAAIKLYAPWCGHCKNMVGAWSDLGEQMKDVEGVHIAAWNAHADRDAASRFEVRGFPTIVLQNLKTGDVEKYRGQRTAEAMAKWIKETIEIE